MTTSNEPTNQVLSAPSFEQTADKPLNKRELDLLENVYAAEIDGAINKHPGVYQTKSKLAKKLESEGYLQSVTEVLRGTWPVTIEGYRLTLLGNFTYCMSARCADEPI